MQRLCPAAVLIGVILMIPTAALPADGIWSELSPSGPARWGHAMVYDSRRDRLLVQGGTDNARFLADVWEFPLATNGPWKQLLPLGIPPSPRAFHAAVYDPDFDRMIVFGGYDGGGLGDAFAL